jgi:hypothetical protein
MPKPHRVREKRVRPPTRVTYSIAEYCEMNGLSREAVARSIDDGLLRVVKIGHRRLVIAGQRGKPNPIMQK